MPGQAIPDHPIQASPRLVSIADFFGGLSAAEQRVGAARALAPRGQPLSFSLSLSLTPSPSAPAMACGILNKYLSKQHQGQGPGLLKTIIKLPDRLRQRGDHYVFTAAIFGATFMQNKQPATCLHPGSFTDCAGSKERQEKQAGRPRSIASCVSLRYALPQPRGQQLIWNRPPNISAHTYRNAGSAVSSSSSCSSSASVFFFRWQHDLHFVFSCSLPLPLQPDLICILGRTRLSDTLLLVLPALFWFCFLLHLQFFPSSPLSSLSLQPCPSALFCFCLFMSCPSAWAEVLPQNCCVGSAKPRGK